MVKSFSLLLLSAVALFGQGTLVDLGNQGSNADFFKFPYTRTIAGVTLLPATCLVGQSVVLVDNLSTPTTGVFYHCVTTNTWNQVGAGGASGNATSIIGFPVIGTPTNTQVLSFNTGTNQWNATNQIGTTYNAGTGLSLGGTTFSIDTSYFNTNYWNLATTNIITTQATPLVAAPTGKLIVYGKGNQFCTFDEFSVETCTTTGTAFPIANTNITPIDLSIIGSNGGIKNTLGLANGGTNGTTKQAAFDNLSPLTTLGDILSFSGGHNVRVAGNTTTTPQVWVSTGSGGLATLPVLSPFVSSVNGSSGAVTVSTGNFQTLLINGTAVTNRAKLGFTGTGGITVTNTDNGSDTQTVNINASGTTPAFSSGSTAPVSTCASANLGAGYQQTGITTNNTGPRTWICSNVGGTFRWVLISNHVVDLGTFAPAANGTTDDSGVIRAAVTFAKTTFNYGGDFWTSDINIPCGRYGIGSPIVLPRTGKFPYGAGGGLGPNGVVNLVGESAGCVVFVGLGTFPNDIKGIRVTYPGSNGHSAATASLSGGGCSTFGTLTPVISQGYVASVYLASAPTACSTPPTCTIVGTGGTGATCQALGRSIIEWAAAPLTAGGSPPQATNGQIIGQSIKNITFIDPPVDGDSAISFIQTAQDSVNIGPNGTNTQAERFGGANFENLVFDGNNQYNPVDIYLGGDCVACTFYSLSSQPLIGNSKYETTLLATSTWTDGVPAEEGGGCNFGCAFDNLSSSSYLGGNGSTFQGRINKGNVTNMFCDGTYGGKDNSYCFEFIATQNTRFDQLSSTGGGDTAQLLLLNSGQNTVDQISLGAPMAVGNVCPSGVCTGAGNGMSLVNADENTFNHHVALLPAFSTRGVFALVIDTSSHNNKFLDWQLITGTTDAAVVDTQTNYVQFCDPTTSSCFSGTTFSSIGYIVGVSLNGNGAQPACGANSRGALWPSRGTTDGLQQCGPTGWFTVSSGGTVPPPTVVTVTFTATPIFNFSSGIIQRVTLTGNVTSFTLSGVFVGLLATIDFIQDSTGSRTVSGAPATVHGMFTIGGTGLKHNVQQFYSPDGVNLYAVNSGVINQ